MLRQISNNGHGGVKSLNREPPATDVRACRMAENLPEPFDAIPVRVVWVGVDDVPFRSRTRSSVSLTTRVT